MNNGDEHALRLRIGALLKTGLHTPMEKFPETDEEFRAVREQLKDLDPGDLIGKLVLAGFADKPRGPDGMRCQECMYYLVERKVCELPELTLPVEPDWWCRLWRI